MIYLGNQSVGLNAPENIKDVQVNGTSVVQDGVAKIPVANAVDKYGIVKVNGDGLTVVDTGQIRITPASEALIKSASANYNPVAPARQHLSTFYGLAKAAGDATQSSSSNTVGNYTDAAKVAIQKMLGIYEAPWELIREDTVTNATEADIEITADGNGNAFELTDVAITFISPKQDTAFVKGDYGRIQVFYDSNYSYSVYIGAYTQNAQANQRISFGVIEQKNGMVVKYYTQNVANGSNTQIYTTAQDGGFFAFPDPPKTFTKISMTAITGTVKYKIYGRRKWN